MKRVFNFYISTHSLTRRLTLSANITQTKQNYFNSQPHKEADQIATSLFIFMLISTHSLTRRLTKIRTQNLPPWEHFNSQPHKEADGHTMGAHGRDNISTHSLTRRLTKSFYYVA